MASLARLTGHDEGYVRTDREEKRAAAIERWLAWWEREGKADYAAAHPEVRAVLSVDEYEAVEEVDAEALPVLLDVADADPQAPVVFKVPREDIPGLLKGRRVIARRYGKDDLRWSFASADAAAAWFAGLRMRPARDGGAPSEALEELGPADDFTGVTVDHGGRPWRWQDRGGVPLEEVKRQVETAAETKRPFVSGAEVLLIDRRGRIWLRTYKIIFGYDPSERRWIERLGLTKEQRVGFEEVQDTGLFNITGPGYESASGVLFFGDRLGVHVYDGATWRHQSLYERNLREKRYYEGPSFFERPEFSEDDDGRVYVWSKWGSGGHTGTIGFWIYDRGHWENRDIIERLRTVVPLGRDEIWLCTDTSELALLKGDKLVTGEEAQKALHPNLRFKYAYGRAFDPRGTAFFRLEAVTTLEPIAKHRLRGLALPRRGSARDLGESSAAFFEGLEALPCKVDAQGWLWGVSRGGRLAGLSPDGAQTRSFSTSTTMSYALGLSATTLYAVGPDQCVYFRGGGTTYRYDSGAARAADATSCAAVPAMVVPIAGLAWPDSRGRMWCTFKTKEAPTAVFEADTWNVVDRAAEGIRRFELGGYFVAIPGTNGAMVFVDREHRWHFFDGDGRVHAASAEALILEHRDRLARGCKYPASRPGNEAGFHLVQDARGRFWWARWFHEWGVVDGARAIRGKDSDLGLGRDRGEPFEVFSVVGDGTKLLAIKRGGGGCLLDVRDGEIVRAGDVPIPVDPMGGRVSVFRDSSGRHWLRNDRRSAAVGPDGKPGDTHEGRLVLEDRTKGLWFSISHPGGQRAVKRVGANGAETVLLVPDLVDSPFLAEAPDGTVWALTRSGLVRVRDEGERLAIVEKHAVPVSMEDQLWCDGEGRVWLARPSREIIRYATAARATF